MNDLYSGKVPLAIKANFILIEEQMAELQRKEVVKILIRI